MPNPTQAEIDTAINQFCLALGLKPAQPPAFFTRAQVSQVTGVPVGTLANQAIRGGGPPFTKFSKSVKYPVRELAIYVLKHTYSHTGEIGQQEAV